MWRRIRIGILLVVLFVVAAGAWNDRTRTTRWEEPLWVGIFPVNGDGRDETGRYIAALDQARFAAIEQFFAAEAAEFGIGLERPMKMVLYPPLAEPPPRLAPGTGLPGRIWWSLGLRWYTWRQAGGTPADIRLFVLYHDPAGTDAVGHSLGLQAGLLGIVNAWATPRQDGPNNVVIAHELLHTLGATDKYDPATNLPLFPQGYAEPDATPRHPQTLAEIMGGRIPLAPDEAVMPGSLYEVIVGPETASEIRWPLSL